MSEQKSVVKSDQNGHSKKHYSSPAMTEYGNLSSLTKSGGNDPEDSAFGSDGGA